MTPEAYQALEEKLKVVIADQLGLEVDEVQSDLDLVNDLDADSLDMVEIVMALEEMFGIQVPDADAEDIETFGELVAYVATKVPDFTVS